MWSYLFLFYLLRDGPLPYSETVNYLWMVSYWLRDGRISFQSQEKQGILY